MTETDEELRALAHAARALPRLRDRQRELNAEWKRTGDEMVRRQREELSCLEQHERRQEITWELRRIIEQIKAAERADARLRERCPADLLQAEKSARESVRASRHVLEKQREALGFAQVGSPDPELVEKLEGNVAAAEEALKLAEEAHRRAVDRVDLAHDQLRVGPRASR